MPAALLCANFTDKERTYEPAPALVPAQPCPTRPPPPAP
jgi:hypothetical protein